MAAPPSQPATPTLKQSNFAAAVTATTPGSPIDIIGIGGGGGGNKKVKASSGLTSASRSKDMVYTTRGTEVQDISQHSRSPLTHTARVQ